MVVKEGSFLRQSFIRGPCVQCSVFPVVDLICFHYSCKHFVLTRLRRDAEKYPLLLLCHYIFFSVLFVCFVFRHSRIDLSIQRYTAFVIKCQANFFFSKSYVTLKKFKIDNVNVCACVGVGVSLASDFSETIEVIIVKLGTVTASYRNASHDNYIDLDLHSRSHRS